MSNKILANEMREELVEKYLTFRLQEEEYCLKIILIQQIITIPEITNVPLTPDYLKGVINFRGKVVPVIDLAFKFGMGNVVKSSESCVIIVPMYNREYDLDLEIGLLIDKMSDVISFTKSEIDKDIDFGSLLHSDAIVGVYNSDNRAKIVVNPDKILTEDDIKSFAKLTKV